MNFVSKVIMLCVYRFGIVHLAQSLSFTDNVHN